MWQCYILWNQESYGLWKYGIKRQWSKSPVTVRTELQGLLFIFNVWEDTILKDEIKTLISLPFVKKKRQCYLWLSEYAASWRAKGRTEESQTVRAVRTLKCC